MKPRTARQVSLVLGALSVAAIVLALLALQDIYHGEPDLSLEWSAVRMSFLTIIAFHGFALFALWQWPGEPDGAPRSTTGPDSGP
jgi:hypothetical protein